MAKAPAPVKPRKALAKAAVPPTIEQSAQSELDPVIAAITNAATARARAAEAAINGYTQSYANQLGQIDAGAPYGAAEQKQAAVDAALEASLSGGGQDLASQLASRLAALDGSSGAGALQQAGGALASQGGSAGGAVGAMGSASLGQLIGEHAAADSFSKKLPGLAKLSGLQGLKQAEGNAQNDINQGTMQVESKLPDVVQQIRSARQAARSLASENAYRQAEIGLSSQRNQIAQYRANTSARQGAARIAIAQQNANTAATRAAQTAAQDLQRNKQAWARIGIQGQKLQMSILKADAAAKAGGLTPASLAKARAVTNSWGQRLSGTTTDPNTLVKDANGNLVPKQLPQLSFKDAMTQVLSKGVPLSVAFPIMLKHFKAAGATPYQVRAVVKEYAPFDKAITGALKRLPPPVTPANAFSGLGAVPTSPRKGGMAAAQGYKAYRSSTAHAGGFLPAGMGFSYDRHDQGRDIQAQPGAPIIAPGDGFVVRIASDPGGGGGHFGPSYPIVHFTSGPYAGKDVYIGHTVAAVRPGQRFRAGQVLSRTQRSGPMNGGAPSGWAEIGFAAGGTPGPNGQVAPF